MSEILTSIVLVLFVISVVYIVKKLLETDNEKRKIVSYIVIPIYNDLPMLKRKIKSEYWDEIFLENNRKLILLYPLEVLNESTKCVCNDLCQEFSYVKLIDKMKIDDYFRNTKT